MRKAYGTIIDHIVKYKFLHQKTRTRDSYSWDYHNAWSHGGVITGNEQHLKIRYVNYERLGNVILFIEELPCFLPIVFSRLCSL